MKRNCWTISTTVLFGAIAVFLVRDPTLADPAKPAKPRPPKTTRIAKSGSLAKCRMNVKSAAASIDRSLIVGPGKRPGPFQANITLLFDNTASAKPATFKIASGTVRDSSGKDYPAVWWNAFTGKVWDGKVPAGNKREIHFFFRMKTELRPKATMILQVTDKVGRNVWLRSDSVPVRILR